MIKIRLYLIPIIFLLFLLSNKAAAETSVIIDQSYPLDFGIIQPGSIVGDIPAEKLRITCTTDRTDQWILTIYAEKPFTHIDDSTATISNEKFYWYGREKSGSGTLVTTATNFEEEREIYTATPGEGAGGIEIKMQFMLDVPGATRAGNYDTVIVFTLK